MISRLDCEVVNNENSFSAIETALRWLATRKDGVPLRYLRYAIEDPTSGSAAALGCLVEATASLPGGAAESRALAIWGLIAGEIGRLGSAQDSRRRNTLLAAFRLFAPPGTGAAWKGTLDDRFRQLMGLRGVFGDPPPCTTAPMHKAWKRAVERLAACLEQRLAVLGHDGNGWLDLIEIGKASTTEYRDARLAGIARQRRPSRGAQPLFLERMIVRVVMHRKTALRRITERTVVACEDGVDGYGVHALTGWSADLADIPVKAIWNCRLVTRPGAHAGDPAMARLRFRKKLRRGERYSFVSEALDEHLDQKRLWINVDIDHHGVAPGEVDRHGEPVAGLTIQLSFDEECLPESVWWYAEQTDHERLCLPPAGDPHLLVAEDGFVQHTFADPCQPRENYGIAFRWPREG